ncbi:GNAT family N-acetyltransferase [Metabacillus litoralis]|uniref:GNAT family N-acetyltransferase n=1 Tax=Metabacillus litoralis TaxID=152268 RepID=A0A5C6W5M6_9BACI|nr:GNAT family N-acetyltransferase [Metabacillus litoralis]TXC91134.1 GNAT family N-acetyltransferase [Metabacillus litoralis]
MNEHYIEALDIAYISSFSTKIKTSWGYLFLNENQPDYYDANHAHISSYLGNYNEIVDEVVSFYQARNIIPRFYLSQYENNEDFITVLKQRGFGFEEFSNPVQLWNKKVEIEKIGNVTIEEVTLENKREAIDIECQIQEFGCSIREKAFEEEFSNPNYTHYLLRYDGVACSTACVFYHNKDARLESVATIESYRGKGLVGQLIHYIQKEVEQKQIERFWVLPINERVEKVYKKSGFETILNFKTGHAFLGGKSVEEIRNGL